MRTWRIASLALNGLRRSPLRVTLTALGVAIACGALVSMVAFALGLQRQIETPMRLLALLNDIHVSPKEGERAKNAPILDDEAIDRLAQLPGVSAAYPNIRLRGIKIRRGDHTENCVAVAIPREAQMLGVAEEFLLAGRFLNEGHAPEAILGAPLLHALGFTSPQAAIGQTLILEASGLLADMAKSFTFQRKELSVTVVGVYDLPMIVPGPIRPGLLLPVDLMKQVPGAYFESALTRLKAGGDASMAGYGSVTVHVREPADLDRVEKQIKALGFQTSTTLSHFNEMRVFFIFLEVFLAAVGTVALVVAGLGIVNTLLMAVLERYQEIGICKAIGASQGDLVVLFLTEAGFIGLLGGLGGLLLGRIVSYGLEVAVGIYAGHQGATAPPHVFAFPLWLLGGTLLFAVVVSVVAGVYPALLAARVDPIRALRRG
jgi:putative ABC transport system permease protein